MLHTFIEPYCPQGIPSAIMLIPYSQLLCSCNHRVHHHLHLPKFTLQCMAVFQIHWTNEFQWHDTLAWIPTKPIQNKCTETHVGEDKVFWETLDLTSRVKVLELSLVTSSMIIIWNKSQWLLLSIIHNKFRHITSRHIKARNNLFQCL